MQTKTEEECDNCKNVARYNDEWHCILCWKQFEPTSNTLEEELKKDYNIQSAGTG